MSDRILDRLARSVPVRRFMLRVSLDRRNATDVNVSNLASAAAEAFDLHDVEDALLEVATQVVTKAKAES